MFKNVHWLTIFFVAAATAICGELRIAPFGTEFRFGLGSSAFFLLLLLFPYLPYIWTGFVTGLVVVIFRTLTSSLFINDPSMFIDAWNIHFSAFFYYLVFGIGMFFLPKKLPDKKLLLFGLFVIGVDVLSNIAEINARFFFLQTNPLLTTEWLTLVVVAAIRVYFVLGLYVGLKMQQMSAVHAEQQKRFEQTLTVSSTLYGESFYMKKMMNDIESITGKSYRLYQKLQDLNLPAPAREALFVSENIHEIKKDAQRVTSGLMKLHDNNKIFTTLDLSEVIHYVVIGNQSYSTWLNKEIEFTTDLLTDYKTDQHLALLSVLNNLTSNAVEAISESGTIFIQVSEKGDQTLFTVTDDGQGIKEQDVDFVFEAGYTTKYHMNGEASTGIGLSHVKHVAASFDGAIEVTSPVTGGAQFVLTLPTYRLKQEDSS
ncbi:sensor histidine kinase [Alkalicoccobacillus gibsonii]|uniref:sensor histidine kinase n=1 Tax=Alkalicoccobacillus gibsonii TaxID=79881 RepID=UPI0019321F97|nr:ATP-binding protein [Alkalicoccobacillus gibsonii]MBM0065980.1 ATP-binding protein [Alkalicoccobacillus gibsonii]